MANPFPPSLPFDRVVDALVAARRSGVAADAEPLAEALTDAEAAYRAEAAVAARLGGAGAVRPARHWKSGAASREAPVLHSPLPPQGVWASPAEAGDWPFHARGVEAEIALRLGPSVTARQAAALDRAGAQGLVEAMTVSIEVVDSRWRQRGEAPAWLRLADLQSHAALVLGDWQVFQPRDWAAQVCRLRVGAQAERCVRGTHACGDPAWVLVDWLRHATRDGDLPAGAVVTTGSWVGTVPAEAGDRVEAVFDGIGGAVLQL